MKWLALAALFACSNSQRTAAPERTATAEAGPKVAAPADAAAALPDAPAPSARSKEVEDALHAIWSEHSADVPPKEFWKAHAAEVRPALREVLARNPDGGQGAMWALRILGDIGNPADVDLLAKAMNEAKFETTRAHAADALGVHPAATAGEALLTATRLADVKIASYAVSGLGFRTTDAAARARLEELLGHADSTMRYRAVDALAALGGSKDALQKRLRVEKDPDVRAAIKEALQGK